MGRKPNCFLAPFSLSFLFSSLLVLLQNPEASKEGGLGADPPGGLGFREVEILWLSFLGSFWYFQCRKT
jgi:hypothetical protein